MITANPTFEVLYYAVKVILGSYVRISCFHINKTILLFADAGYCFMQNDIYDDFEDELHL